MTYTMTFRRLRWLTTLYRHGAIATNCRMPAWRRVRHAAVAACLFFLAQSAAAAATLRAFSQVSSSTVRLSDLFENLGAAPDRVLGPSPAPGEKITVEAPQLAAIARDYAVDWRPESGAERVILQRDGVRLAKSAVLQKLRAALTDMGAAADGEINLPGFEPPLLPAAATPDAAITETSFDPATGRFTALLSVSAAGMQTETTRLSGQLTAMLEAAVLTHHLRPGTILSAEDIHSARVRSSLLHGNVPVSMAAALGQALRHDLPPGQPLTTGDIARPVLVARNSAVRMSLDSGEISVSAQGLAMEDGGLGETVRVQNPSSKAVVLATVTGAGEVRVLAERAALEVAVQ